MNKHLLALINRLPEPLLVKYVRAYVDANLKKHAQIHVEGLENLDSGVPRPYLFVCNHLSNSDGLILSKVLEKEDPIFLAGKKLESNSYTDLGLKIVKTIPISPNSADKEALKKVLSAVKEGSSIFIFPEGTRSRTAQMIEGKKGIFLIAKLTNAPIVPIGIWGTELFMPIQKDMENEAFYDADIHINIGRIFSLPQKEQTENKDCWEARCLELVMTEIARLLPKEYQGFYENKVH